MSNNEAYDYNVYGDSDNTLCLTAYEWERLPDGNLQMNSSMYHTIQFQYPQHLVEIEYLLNDLAINHYPFTDYDTWKSLKFLTRDTAPENIKTFLDNLPSYTMKEA